MALGNTQTRFGVVSKTFHWLTAAGILMMLPMGVVAVRLPYDTPEQLAQKAELFSLHKTVGIALFFIALLRILWALSQPRPVHLAPKRSLETIVADTAHWLLYGALVVVPLSGWIHHAATEGFAPILWPFGQNLPLVPESETVAHAFKVIHFAAAIVLVLTLLGHIGGALKHHVIVGDDTLRRMSFGRLGAAPTTHAHPHVISAFLAALIWAGVLVGGPLFATQTPPAPSLALAERETGWEVTEGTLGITVQQFEAAVEGRFATWSAAIQFDETASGDPASHGSVEVEVAIGSLTLGSVTDQAMGPDFFDAEAFPTALFTADIQPDGESYTALGSLSIKGTSIDAALPFSLEIEGDQAVMSGTLTLDRRDFGIGLAMTDVSQLGNEVEVQVELTATRKSE